MPYLFGTINSRVDRTNDVPKYLERLEVTDLVPYLLITEKTQAFVYRADLGRKHPIHIVEIYQDFQPRETAWRRRDAQIALWLDILLIDGLDDGVAIPDFVVPFASTAQEEAMLAESGHMPPNSSG